MTDPRTRTLLTPAHHLADRYDVVVIGSGCAGITAALVAAHAGQSVLIVEKDKQLGGTTAAGGGVMWAPNNHLMPSRGFTDTARDAAAYLRAATRGRLSDHEIAWYLKTSAAAIRFLDDYTRVEYAPLARPDYHMEWPGATPGGRGLDHQEFDPSIVPGLAQALRPPTYLPRITMDERDRLHGGAPDPALLAARAQRGIRTMGGALAGALIASAWEAGVVISAPSPATGLERIVHGGAGSLAEDGADLPPQGDRWMLTVGDEVTVRTRSLVIASGGFEWSPQLTGTLLRFPIVPISAPSNEGDGLRLGLAAGASIAETQDIWGVPVLTAHGAEYGGRPSGRMGNVEATLPGSVVVNRAGRRFVNEALNYHDFSRVFGNVDPVSGDFANIPAYLVVDSRYAAKYPVAGHPVFSSPADAPAWMVQADTVTGLADRIGVDPNGLVDTLRRFNEHARTGEDPDFGRGATDQDRHLGDPANTPNPCLAPVETAPFYAVQLHPGALGTAGGLRTDLDGQVLDWRDEPLGGLYAAGNCSATVFRDAYPGGGATIGSAITRAFAVGTHIVSGTGPVQPPAADTIPAGRDLASAG